MSSKPHGDTNATACCHAAIRTRTSMLHLALIQQVTPEHRYPARFHPASRTGTPLFRLLSPSSQNATPLPSLQRLHAASHTGTPRLSLISTQQAGLGHQYSACVHPASMTGTPTLNLVLIRPATPGHQCFACAHLASQAGTPMPSLLSSSKPGQDTTT